MKIALLAAQTSIHTVRWVNELSRRGHDIFLITMHPGGEVLEPKVKRFVLPFKPLHGYYLNILPLRNILKAIKPEILNTHYASGYGTLARLSGFHPNLLSIWGSDIFDFPYQSKMKMRIIKKNIVTAERVASTSWVMKKQIESIQKTDKEIVVTPFGIDCTKFTPRKKENSDVVRIGTIKGLAPKYGIDYLIKAYAKMKKMALSQKTELVLIGKGPQEHELKQLVIKLNIEVEVKFIGHIKHDDVPEQLNNIDIFVALSTLDSESFGVAILEASTCGIPVVVANVGGLNEIVKNGETGFIVPKNNPDLAADKLHQLVNSPKLRQEMGNKGRDFVLANYNWSTNVSQMEKLYIDIINSFKYKK